MKSREYATYVSFENFSQMCNAKVSTLNEIRFLLRVRPTVDVLSRCSCCFGQNVECSKVIGRAYPFCIQECVIINK